VIWFLNNALFYDNCWVRGDVYGDLPFHMYLITSLIYGCNRNRRSLYDLTSPFYAHLPLAYPVIPNFISALMIEMFGRDIHSSLAVPSFFFAVSLFINLASIVRRFSHSNDTACCIAPWLFLLLGGRGFLYWLDPDRRSLGVDFVHHWGGETYNFWFQNLAHVMLPQRSSLFSLPIAFSVLLLSILVDFDCLSFRHFFSMGLIVGILPQVHPHSLIALFEFSMGLFLVHAGKLSTKYFLCFAVYGLTALAISAPQLVPYFSRTVGERKGRFFEFGPLWHHRQRGPFGFWYDGLGPFVVLALIHGVVVADRRQLSWYFPSLVVFAMSNFILYQPWFMDNTKVFNAGWTALAVAVVANFLSKVHFIPRIALVVFCCASGAIPCWRVATQRMAVWSSYERAWELADWVKENTDPASIWMTGTMHAHPVMFLAGRQSFLGPYNYLSNHGVDPSERFEILDILKANVDNTDRLDKFKVDYICKRDGDQDLTLKFPPGSKKWKQAVRIGAFTVWQRLWEDRT
jgi:hypothetical protein